MVKNFGILLAWPETKCKQAGAWYDPLMVMVGWNKDGYYKVGHAAYVLIKGSTGQCLYFDFGRYHAPKGHGRVRSAVTDHDLQVKTIIEFDKYGQPINLIELYAELMDKKACHGDGKLHAGCVEVDYEASYRKIIEMQRMEFLPYGPFVRKGTNCSRFVKEAALGGLDYGLTYLLLKYPLTISPTPKWNTVVGKKKWTKYTQYNEEENSNITTSFTTTT